MVIKISRSVARAGGHIGAVWVAIWCKICPLPALFRCIHGEEAWRPHTFLHSRWAYLGGIVYFSAVWKGWLTAWRPPYKSKLTHRVLKKNLLLSHVAWGRKTASWGHEGHSSEGAQCAPSLEGLLCGHSPHEKVTNSFWALCGLVQSCTEAFIS